MKHAKKQKSMAQSQEILIKTVPEEAHISDLLDKYFKSTVLHMFIGLKKTMDKEIKETRRIIFQQIENIDKEVEILKGTTHKSGAEKYNN